MRLAQLIGPELEALISEHPSEVPALVREIHPEDLADFLEDLGPERAAPVLIGLPNEYAAQVFERFDEDLQEELTRLMGVQATTELALEMDADERADFIEGIEPKLSLPLLESIGEADPEVAEDLEDLRRWPETSAGGLMTTDYLTVSSESRVKDAIEEVKENADEAETIDAVYVVGEGEQLTGVVTLRDLLRSPGDAQVDEVMRRNVISVDPEMDQEEVAHKIGKYDLHTIPVVSQGELLGVITSDDILDVIAEEQDEDVQKMGAIAPIREGYFDTSFREFFGKRAVWLVVLFLGGFLSTQAMAAYESALAAITQLSFYLPLLISAGGNSGAQSSTLIIRGLAVGEITLRDWWRVLARELGQGLSLGALLACMGVARALVVGDGAMFALLIGLTIIAIVVLGCVIGGMTPLLLHRVGLDPATSSTPFIATVVDVVGIVLYMAMAQVLLLGAASAAPVSAAIP